MSFWVDYLKGRGKDPWTEFSVEDQTALAWFLTEIRLRGSTASLVFGVFRAPARLPESERLEHELSFVASFLCFFISKSQPFVDEMVEFCNYYARNFVDDAQKQEQLARAIRAPFFTATEADLETAESLDVYIDLSVMRTKASA